MKKAGVFTFIIIALMIAGCGNKPEPTKGKVIGTIVDPGNNPVSGMVIKIGTQTATSQSDGSFTFASVPVGACTVIVNGGSPNSGDTSNAPGTGRLAATVKKTVIAGDNNFGAIQVYNMLGYGVISKSTSAIESSSFSGTGGKYLKDSITGESLYVRPGKISPKRLYTLGTTRDAFWDLNPRFIYLKWTPLTDGWVSHYQISYLGTDGALNEPVWDSDDTHSGDPAFDLANPKAYLDIADELDGIVNGPGVYWFRISGVSADETQSKPLPAITISIGVLMSSFPTLSRNSDLLSWTEVTGADEYATGIYKDSITLANELWRGTTTQLSITMDSSGLSAGDTCCWSLNAHSLDEAGWTAEIINTTTQFVY